MFSCFSAIQDAIVCIVFHVYEQPYTMSSLSDSANVMADGLMSQSDENYSKLQIESVSLLWCG